MIDVDQLFDNYLNDYLARRGNDMSYSEIERKISEIYEEFIDSPQMALNGYSPKGYFENMDTETLIKTLVDSVDNAISVSDVLCSALARREDSEDGLIDLIDESNDELSTYAVNILNEKGSLKPLRKYIEIVRNEEASESLTETVLEGLCSNANAVKEEIIYAFENSGREQKQFVEVLACMDKDDRVYDLLISEFESDFKNLSLNASYLAKYGDERAVNPLLKRLEKGGLTQIETGEIISAIKKLGGEVPEDLN